MKLFRESGNVDKMNGSNLRYDVMSETVKMIIMETVLETRGTYMKIQVII